MKAHLKNLIKKCDFELINPFEGCYLLVAEKCIIKLTYDRGDVSCNFLPPFASPYQEGYNVSLVYRLIYANINQKGNREFDALAQLSNLALIIQDYLMHVLEGDFSWIELYLKEQNRDIALSSFFFKHLTNTVIAHKFWSGDDSWKDDVEKYLIENKIRL